MSTKRLGVVDYGLGNLFSVLNCCQTLGVEAQLVSDEEQLLGLDAVILPGVGAFGDAVRSLKERRMWEPLQKKMLNGHHVLGVCLGMQLLFESSEEFGAHGGFGIFPGKVQYLRTLRPTVSKVPEMGWNKVQLQRAELWQPNGLDVCLEGRFFYFVHSLAVSHSPSFAEAGVCTATTEYDGVTFVSALGKGNVVGVQFHPERSASDGLNFYRKWLGAAGII